MKNKAKCKLCNSIIESFHATDYVICSCGEIALDGGEAMRCIARDLTNIIRIDDEGNEIIPKVLSKREWIDKIIAENKETILEQDNPDTNLDEKEDSIGHLFSNHVRKKELLEMLDEMIKNIESLPQVALSTPVTHYDLLSSLLLISAIFRAS